MNTTTTANTVAAVILAQLGGNKFVAMTGAKNFLASDNALTFRLPSHAARHRVNMVRITLNALDLYNVEWMNARGLNCKAAAPESSNVHCADLRAEFTRVTGLYTSL